jgi:hypothetical protein
MRIGIITLLVTVHVSFTRPALCQDQPSGPLSGALRFFDQAASTDIDSTLRWVRKTPLSSEERDAISDSAWRPMPPTIRLCTIGNSQ